MPKPIMIGDLARRTGTKVNTVRFYEQMGLLPEPGRTPAGRRIYGESDVRRLTFIRHARALGFNTSEIRSLLKLAAEPERDCSEARQIAHSHLLDVRKRIKQLRQLEAELSDMVANCGPSRSMAECHIMEALEELPDEGFFNSGRERHF